MVIKLSPFSCTYIVIICGFPPCSDFIKLSFYSTPCCMVFLQVGCVCSPERRGKDAFSIIYPRCSAEISWQMAEDRPAGMYTRRRQWHEIIFIVVGFVFWLLWLFFCFFSPQSLDLSSDWGEEMICNVSSCLSLPQLWHQFSRLTGKTLPHVSVSYSLWSSSCFFVF